MTDQVTCSFVMNRDVYEAYKNIVLSNNENVKGNLVRYMKSVIRYGITNAETIEAISEVEAMKNDPQKKTYSSFNEILEEIYEEIGE